MTDAKGLPLTVALVAVGLTVGGLLVGYEPVGGDPDRLYRPLKMELGRLLGEGRLPFWSDRFGLGVPLVAESQVAAFYPPNWILYGALDVSTAYRLAMWLHYLALVGATYAYARRLGILPWGCALAAVAFTLCGFQTVHASHEPFYSALPFLPLALLCADCYVTDGSRVALALLAIVWGVQLTLGHFQLQMWTAALVLLTGGWRMLADGRPRRCAPGLVGALALGAGVAAVQVVLSWDYARFVGAANRPVSALMFYSYPPAHWTELAIPRMFQGLESVAGEMYWAGQSTSRYEAALYIGTVPLILAFVGLAARRSRAMQPWPLIVVVSFALATMPHWWPAGYEWLLQLPGLGYFRAPGRYTLITSLGLALLAGSGFDRAISSRRFVAGLVLAAVFATTAAICALWWAARSEAYLAASAGDLQRFVSLAALAWILSFCAVGGWRARKLGHGLVFVVAAMELGLLYYCGPVTWGRSVDLPEQSPVLRRLARESTVGTVAGDVDDLPVRANHSPTYPYLGMPLPPPNRALEFAKSRLAAADPSAVRLLRRLGVTHGIWTGPVPGSGSAVETLYEGPDEALDRLVYHAPGAPDRSQWHLVRYADVPPAVSVAVRVIDAGDLQTQLAQLTRAEFADTASFLPSDRPPDLPQPRARVGLVTRWDGLQGEIEHDGVCDVVIRRTYVPGWTARIDDGPEIPIVPVNGGLQSVRLSGSGRTHVALQYRPPRLTAAVMISVTSSSDRAPASRDEPTTTLQ